MNLGLGLAILLSTSGCDIVVKDIAWMVDMGPLGAVEIHTLSDVERNVPKAQWDKERFGMLCTSSDNFAEQKKLILKLCEESKSCKFEDQKKVKKFFDHVEKVSKKIKP